MSLFLNIELVLNKCSKKGFWGFGALTLSIALTLTHNINLKLQHKFPLNYGGGGEKCIDNLT